MTRNYESIKGEALVKRRAGDQNEWDLGDLFVEAEDLADSYVNVLTTEGQTAAEEDEDPFAKGSREILNRLADDIGMARKAVQLRSKISRRVAKAGSLGWIRYSTLTYSVMRELYALESDTDISILAKKVISQNMTIREVRTEMENHRDKKLVDAGSYKCANCKEAIANVDAIISVTGDGKRSIFDSWQCAASFVTSKVPDLNQEFKLTPRETSHSEDREDVFEVMEMAL